MNFVLFNRFVGMSFLGFIYKFKVFNYVFLKISIFFFKDIYIGF